MRPFVAEELPLVRTWFEHIEVRRRLGGPEWPARALELLRETSDGDEFRGARVLRGHHWLAWLGAEPVGYLGGDVYDRWCEWDGSDPDHPRVGRAESGPAMSAAYVVAPEHWRRGHGTALLRAWLTAAETTDVRVFELGVEADNQASLRCAAKAGFEAASAEPDWEGTLHLLVRRG